MASCLNLSDPEVKRVTDIFGEIKIKNLVDKYFNEEFPGYVEFLRSNSVRKELGIMTAADIKSDLGISVKKEIYNEDQIRLNQAIDKKNTENFRKGIPINYFANYIPVGQSALYNWIVTKRKGMLDAPAKLQRAIERGKLISDIEKAIKEKGQTSLFESEPQTVEEQMYSMFPKNEAEIRKARANEIAQKLGEKFKIAFGIDYQMISKEVAEDLLENTPTPLKPNASAFYYGNKIYFIDGKFSVDNVIHEFAHPLIKGIAAQNRTLFENLYFKLMSTATGEDIHSIVTNTYPELEQESDRFKEEVIVTALERDAMNKIDGIISDDKNFNSFIDLLMYAIKQMINKLMGRKIDLKKLKSTTDLEELTDMLLGEDFVIENLEFTPSDYAEFKNDIDDFLNDLKSTDAKDFLEAINRFYSEAMFQVGVLKNSPYKLKEKLQGKDGMRILRNLIDNLQTSQTIDPNQASVDPVEVLRQIEEQQTDFNIRANAFINSISEIEVFTKRIQTVINEMKQSNEHLTNEGMAKLAYYQQFLERQNDFLDEIKDTLKLESDNALTKKLLSIGERVRNTIAETRKLEKEFMKDFIVENSDFMNESITNSLKEKLNNILKADNYTEAEIDKVVEQIQNTQNMRAFDVKDLKLPKPTRFEKAVLDAVQGYFAKVITREKITDLLEGKAGDLGILASLMTPYSNIDDPLGSFVRYMKSKLSNAESKSYTEWNDFMSAILPELKAAGYNPNDTGQLAKLLMFTDKIPSKNDKGEYEEFEVLSLIDKFTGWRAEIGRLNDALEKARETEDLAKIRQAQRDIWEFNDKYMHRKYKKEVYDVQKIWFQDNRVYDPSTKTEIVIPADVATQALLERQKAIDQMSIFSKRAFTEMDDILEITDSQIAKRNYDELYNVYDSFGNFKTGDELQKVLVRLHHRRKSAGFNEFITDTPKFQRDLDNYVNVVLASQGITYDETDPEKMKEFNKELQKFFDKNLKIATTPEYQQRLQEIYAQLRDIGSKNRQADIVRELSEYYRQRSALVALVTDKDGEPNGAELSIDQVRLLKSIEDKIVELNSAFDKKTGLTNEQKLRMDQYENKIKEGKDLNSVEQDDYTRLLDLKNDLGLSSLELTNLKMLFKELSEITTTTATDSYLKVFNDVIGDTEIQQLLPDNTIGMGAVQSITAETADEFINSPTINQIKAANSAFAEWFDRNHYSKSYFDKTGKEVTKYFRVKAWSVTRPSDSKYYVKTKITNPANGLELEVLGVPISKYTYTRVKDEYRTIPRGADKSKYVGTIINNRGQYLPREYALGDPNSAYDKKFANDEYYKLKAENGTRWRLLEAYKKQYLKIQEDKPSESKLYLDMPRFRKKSNLEYIQSGQAKADFGSKLEGIKGGALALFKKDAEDAEHKFNFDTDNLLIETDLQGEVITEIPVRGLYRIKANEVSQDVLTSTATYLHSLNEQQVLIEEEPVAKALKNILNDPANAIKETNKVSRQASKARGKQVFIPKGRNKFRRENQRADAYSYYIDRLFYGQGSSQFQNENVWVTKLANNLMGAASRSFIALDVTSALKNKLGMTFQKMVETAGGQYLNAVSAAQGRIRAYKATIELTSKGIYSKGPKSLDLQMMERFDPITGKTKSDFGKSSSRTFIKDFLDGTWMYDSRKLMEVESGLQLFYGMMYHKEIEQIQKDGSVKKIKYVDAFELNADNQMVLKEGINPEWGTSPISYDVQAGDTLESIAKKYYMTAEELKAKNKLATDTLTEGQTLVISKSKMFNDFKLKIQGVGKNLNGLMSEQDSPQAGKYLAYRLFTFYRKYATSMFLNRFQFDTSKDNFGGEVYDWDMGTTTKGYYIRAFQSMYNTVRQGTKYWQIMTKDEKAALRKVAAEGLYLALLALAVTMIFGYDKGDEDRFEKMQKREDEYGRFGWLANHALYQLIMVKRENESFIPVPGIGLDEWLEFTNSTTIVTGPTLDLYSKVMMDLWYMMTGNEKGLYKSDVGPYPWQQKDANGEYHYKLWNHLFGIFGVKGKNVSPIWAIKKNEAFENLN